MFLAAQERKIVLHKYITVCLDMRDVLKFLRKLNYGW